MDGRSDPDVYRSLMSERIAQSHGVCHKVVGWLPVTYSFCLGQWDVAKRGRGYVRFLFNYTFYSSLLNLCFIILVYFTVKLKNKGIKSHFIRYVIIPGSCNSKFSYFSINFDWSCVSYVSFSLVSLQTPIWNIQNSDLQRPPPPIKPASVS